MWNFKMQRFHEVNEFAAHRRTAKIHSFVLADGEKYANLFEY